ncbi:MAG: prepilin-type N-terminal cleavage/methylation domain-containing protein [Terracidiphilus sp.]|jgi:prepilin-type N-terminal cleavage/methylation domain-containing protein
MTTNNLSSSDGFSLNELLVALAIIALVAALIVPKFMNVQQAAKDTVAQQMASELNHVYANWVGSGGTVGSNVLTSDLLTVLSSVGGSTYPPVEENGDPSTLVQDTPASSGIRANVPLPPGVTPATIPSGSVVTLQNGILVAFDNATQQFTTMNSGDSSSLPYTAQDPHVSPDNLVYGPAGYNYAWISTKDPNNPIISYLNGSPVYDSQGDAYIADGVQWYNVTYTPNGDGTDTATIQFQGIGYYNME